MLKRIDVKQLNELTKGELIEQVKEITNKQIEGTKQVITNKETMQEDIKRIIDKEERLIDLIKNDLLTTGTALAKYATYFLTTDRQTAEQIVKDYFL